MDKLQFINTQMDMIGVPYEFMQWTSKVSYPYFVGEFTEEPINTESGLEESTLLLTGFHRGGSFSELEAVKEKIKKHFNPVWGLRGWVNGNAIVVFYEGSFYVPSGEAELKKIQINLRIKEWKVN